jgi:fluoride exporter
MLTPVDGLWVALGSALGGAARYWVGQWVTRLAGGEFPWGTLAVNLSGALLVGVLWVFAGAGWHALAILGFCGSYTTVASFSLQSLQLWMRRHYVRAASNVLGSILLCLVAVWLGMQLGGLWGGGQ